jgi:ketosteroid isomerase-like protein
MVNNQNVGIVKLAYENFGKGNIPGVIDLLSDNIAWVIPEIKNYPPSGTHTGKEEVLKFFESFGGLLDAVSFEPKNFYSDGNTVIVTGFYEFKVKSNGKSISSDWVEIFTIENGKIAKYEEYTDTAAFQNAFEGS